MNRVGVEPELLRWARERSGRGSDYLQKRFPQLEAWERGSMLPTFKQLEAFARATYAPIGYLFLREPPVEELPVTDFRTVGGVEVSRPSPDLPTSFRDLADCTLPMQHFFATPACQRT